MKTFFYINQTYKPTVVKNYISKKFTNIQEASGL